MEMASENAAAVQDVKKGSSKLEVPSTEYQLRKKLLLLATIVATVTYAIGLNQPGGVWQETVDDHHAGDPILRDTHYLRYTMFHYCNAAAFMASLVVCLLLLVLDEKSENCAAALRLVMVFDLLGLMGAYATGSCRDAFTTIFSSVLVLIVSAYILALVFFGFRKRALVFFSFGLCGNQSDDVEKLDGDPKKKQVQEPEELREVLMVLATFAVALTYVAGLNPPGGFWSSTEDGHYVSDPVLQDHHPHRYKAFFVCNTTAFVASLVIIVLLLDKRLSKGSIARFVALYVFIVVALFGLVGAYIAGSSREHDNTIYVACLAAAILIYQAVVVAIIYRKQKQSPQVHKGHQSTFKQIAGFVVSLSKFSSLKKNQDQSRDSSGKEIDKAMASGKTNEEQSRDSGGNKGDKAMDKARDLVMLLATLVVSITYQAGLDPPGGLWPDDSDGHKGGDPILLTTHPTRYKVFFYSNSAAFVASLIVIIMVQSRFLLRRHTLEAAMILDLFGLISAYAAGSCRDASTSIYVVALAGAVLVYVVIHIIFFTLDDKKSPADQEELDGKREMLLLLAILAATLTYQAGLTPPGGFWQANDDLGHQAGFPVLLDNYPRRYKAFFFCNAASFMASVALILLLVNPNLYMPAIQCYALYVCMVAGMFGLMGAYAAGSSRHLRSSIFILALVAAVLAVVAVLMLIFWIIPYFQKKPKGEDKQGGESTTVEQQNDDSSGKKDGNKGENESSGKNDNNKKMREYLMLLGILAASVTYQSGLKPPGGLWQDNGIGHIAGDSVLHDLNKRRYLAFLYSNSTSFMASIVVIVMLLPWKLLNTQLPLWPMHTAILLDMFGLLAAYAAGSARDWETSRNVILLVIPVLFYIAVYAGWFIFQRKDKCFRACSGQLCCTDTGGQIEQGGKS